MPEHLIDQAAFSGAIVYGLEALKRWPRLTFINAHSDAINRTFSLFWSLLIAAGITFQMEGSFQSAGHLVISWPDPGSMYDLGKHFATQWLLNQLVYKKLVK